MKSPLCIAATIAVLLSVSQTCLAQARRHVRPPIAKYQPYTSPYLGMLGPGGAAYGYFTNTQPQEQFRQYEYNFSRNFLDFENQVNKNFRDTAQQLQQSQSVQRTIGTTGHPTSFGNLGNYFPTPR
jgi:hypothetical protein